MTKCSYKDYMAAHLLKSHNIGAGGVCFLGFTDMTNETYQMTPKRRAQVMKRRFRAIGL